MARTITRSSGEGTLLLVNNTINAGSGTIQLKATFPNENRALWPGEFVNVQLIVGVRPQGVSVPLSALQQGQNGAFVYVVQPDHTVRQVPVTIAQTLDGRALIDQGLKAGDTVVTAGQYGLEQRRQGRRSSRRRSARAGHLRSQRGNAVMNIPAPFIRRPIATALLMVAIVLLGGTAYQLLPVAALPNVSFPTIAVTGSCRAPTRRPWPRRSRRRWRSSSAKFRI